MVCLFVFAKFVCLFSPNLFNLFIDDVLRARKKALEKKYEFCKEGRVVDIDVADDSVLVAGNRNMWAWS